MDGSSNTDTRMTPAQFAKAVLNGKRDAVSLSCAITANYTDREWLQACVDATILARQPQKSAEVGYLATLLKRNVPRIAVLGEDGKTRPGKEPAMPVLTVEFASTNVDPFAKGKGGHKVVRGAISEFTAAAENLVSPVIGGAVHTMRLAQKQKSEALARAALTTLESVLDYCGENQVVRVMILIEAANAWIAQEFGE